MLYINRPAVEREYKEVFLLKQASSKRVNIDTNLGEEAKNISNYLLVIVAYVDNRRDKVCLCLPLLLSHMFTENDICHQVSLHLQHF